MPSHARTDNKPIRQAATSPAPIAMTANEYRRSVPSSSRFSPPSIAKGWHAEGQVPISWARPEVSAATRSWAAGRPERLGRERTAPAFRATVRWARGMLGVVPLRPEAVDGILRLDAGGRYRRLVTRVADTELAWGLRDSSGWIAVADDSGTPLLPLWPDPEFAELMARGDWIYCTTEPLPLARLLEEVLPALEADSRGVAIFMTPSDVGIVPAIDAISADLRAELTKYD